MLLRNKKIFFSWIVPALLCCSIAGKAQFDFSRTPQIVNFTKQHYNAHSQNWSLAQGSNGIIYVANNNGLLSFDGTVWAIHRLPGNPVVRSVAVDGNDKIFTGAYGEFGYWEKKDKGPLIYHSLKKLIDIPNFAKEEIWKINTQSDGVLFQSFSKLYRYKDGSVRSIELPGNIMYVFSIRGKDYIQVLDRGIFMVNKDNSTTKISGSEIFSAQKIISIVPFINNTLLMGTVESGFYIYDGNSFSAWHTEAGNFVKINDLNAAIQIEENKYAFGTIRNGVIICDAQGKILHHINRSNGLQNNTVLNLFKDRMGNLWVAMDKGIDEIVINSGLNFFKDIYGNIGAVYTASLINNELYIGSNQGLFHTKVQSYTPFRVSTVSKIDGISEQVWDLSLVDGELICGNNNATYRITGKNIAKISDVPGGWNLQRLATNPKYLLQGSYIGQALYSNLSGKGWQFYKLLDSANFIPSRKIVQQKNNIWIEHANSGIYLLSVSDSFTTNSPVKIAVENTKKEESGYALFELDNKTCLASASGMYEYDDRKKKFILSNRLKTLFGSNFYANKVINNGNSVWLFLSDNTIALVNKKQGNELEKISWVQANFSLVNNYENILQLNDNLFFICGEEGFLIYDRNYFKGNTSTPELFIKDIAYWHNDAYQYGKEVATRIAYKNNSLKITAAHPVFDRDVLFRYSLTGSADDTLWSSWTKSAERELSNLYPGSYYFKVQSNQSDKVVTYSFTVLNPWYRSVVAILVYFLLFLLLIFAVYWYVNRRIKRQNEYIRLQHERKLLEEKRKVEHLTMLQHQKELEKEVIIKSEDVANSAMKLIKNKKVLQKLKTELHKLKSEGTGGEESNYRIQKLSRQVDRYVSDDAEERNLFESGFSKVHEDFFNRLLQKYPQLTSQDLKLAAYLRMNLSSKEIAPLINISIRGVEIKRYRLRKKLNLDSEVNLNDFMIKF